MAVSVCGYERRSVAPDDPKRAVAEVMSYSPPDSQVSANQPMPKWSWDGRQADV